MARIGTCNDCDAKFKIPDSVTATKAKCKKCGGVVAIPAAAGATAAAAKASSTQASGARPPASKAAKGKRATSSRSAPAGSARPKSARPEADRAKLDRTGADAESKPKSGARSARGAGAGRSKGSSSRARSGGRKKSKDKKSPLVPALLILIALGAIIGGVMFVMADDEAPSTDDTATETGSTEETAGDSAGDSTATDDAAAAEAPAPDADADAASAAAPAAAPAAAKPKKDDTPRDPVLAFDLWPPLPGTSDEDFAEWTDLLVRCFIDAPPKKFQKKLQAQLDEVSIVDLTPAIINTFHGLDVSDGIVCRDTFLLVDWWQKRCARKPQFHWEGDPTAVDQEAINLKVKTVEGVNVWWASKVSDPDILDAKIRTYRETVSVALAAKG